jgi:O-antigen/teichoic acid export membrane protein
LSTGQTLRTQRSILNYASGMLFTVATLLTAFFTTPLLVGLLTDVRLGAYRMIIGWYGYLTLLDFGMGGALSPLMARALGKGDIQALRGTLATGTRAYLRLTFLVLFAGLAMTPLVVWQVGVPSSLAGNLNLRTAWVSDLRLAWVVSVLSFLPLGLSPFRSFAEAHQRGYRVNVLMTVQCLLITALSLLFAWSGWGIAGQAWAFTLGIMTFFLMLTWDGVRRDPGLLRSALTAPSNPEIRRAVWSLSVPSLLISVSGRIGLLSDDLVAGGFLGPAMAFSLFVTARLPSLAQAQLQSIGAASWAGLAELHAQRAHDIFNRRLAELTTLVAVLGIAALGPIAAYGRPFVLLWMRGKSVDFGGDAVVIIASVNAFLLGLFSLWGWCFVGTGQVRRLVVPAIISTVINLAASLFLTRRLGLVGPVLGTLVANVAISLWWLPILLRVVFGVSLRDLFGAVAWPLVWGVPYAGALWLVAHTHEPRGWAGLLAEMGLASLGFLVLSVTAILSPTDRTLWRLRLLGLLPFMRGDLGRGSSPPPAGKSNESAAAAPATLAAQPGGADHDNDASARH